MKAKIIVSTKGFSEYLKHILSFNDISDDVEILLVLDSECLSFPELFTKDYPISGGTGYWRKNFQTRIEKNKIKKLVSLLQSVPEQPVTINLSDEDSWIYLSGIGI